MILISLDGFRWDYLNRFKPKHLSRFIEQGVQAESLIPAFPSKTFPNHYTIATGMYPDKHGIIGNSFFDQKLQKRYSINDRETVEDGRFYQGLPLWVNAALTGMVSASYYFVGSEADIQGIRPTYYFNYNEETKKTEQVKQVLDWLELPEKTRPHLITLYFPDMDTTAHDFSPENDEKLMQSLKEVDDALGQLFEGVGKSRLEVNTIIVSDHGMMSLPVDNYIPLDVIWNSELYYSVNNGSLVNINPKPNVDKQEVLQHLQSLAKNHPFQVHSTSETPGFEYMPKNPNWGEFQVLADDGYYFSSAKAIERKKQSTVKLYGAHGFDPQIKDMHGIFYANGPAFKSGYSRAAVKNLDIYPLICHILKLPVPSDIDGNLESIKDVLSTH